MNINTLLVGGKLVWFTGGLDSTFALKQIVDTVDENVTCGYVTHGHINRTITLSEIITRRVTINQLKGSLGTISQDLYVVDYDLLDTPIALRQPLALAQCSVMVLNAMSTTKTNYLPDIVLGWHKEDTKEYGLSVGDLKESQYHDLVNYIKTGVNTFSMKPFPDISVYLPAWDKSKLEMYDSVKDLPITFGHSDIDLIKQDNELYITVTPDTKVSKTKGMQLQYGITGSSIKFNVKDFTVGDMLFLTEYNPNFVSCLLKELFDQFYSYEFFTKEIIPLLKSKLVKKLVSKNNKFFLSDHTKWVDTFSYDDFKTEVSNKFEDRKKAIAEEAAKTLTKAQLVSTITPPTSSIRDEQKEEESDACSQANLKTAIDRLTSMKGPKPGERKYMSSRLVISKYKDPKESTKEVESETKYFEESKETTPVGYWDKEES